MDTVARIQQLTTRLAALDNILRDGEYLAAGVKFELTIGVHDREPDFTIDLGIQANLQEILTRIRDGIVDTRRWYLNEARQEYERLSKFITENSTSL